MDLSVCDMRSINGADFPSFLQGEMGAFLELILPVQYILSAAGSSREQMEPKVLGALLPSYAVAALLPMEEHLPIGEGLPQSAQVLTAGLLILQAAGLAPFVTRLLALLTSHNGYSPFVQINCRVPSNLLCPDT